MITSQFVNAFTQYPDAEELNRDNTMNEVEEYFQYKVDIKPNMAVGSNLYYRCKKAVVNTGQWNIPVLKNGTCSVYLYRIRS